ncbi:hypothetical protein METHPM2_130052 [Pseudomonas sp. PM2]
MLQGSADGDPAAPAGFAEALSERAQKKHPSGCFFYAWNLAKNQFQLTQYNPMWELACLRWRAANQLISY